MSVKCGRCGRCGSYHDSVADVRACFNGEPVAATRPAGSSATRATDKQVKYLSSLMAEASVTFRDGHPIEDTERRTASLLIDNLKERASAERYNEQSGDTTRVPPLHADLVGLLTPATVPLPLPPRSSANVPAGHYAIKSLTGNNDLDFFRVDRPTEGRWAGRTFVHRVIGGKPDSPVRGTTARQALEAIAVDPSEARVRYGREIGRCWKCNRHLTDETSRQMGIGPDCRSQVS